MVSDNETDFDDEQYPPAEDKYKQLEDRLKAMEIQQVPGLDFGDLVPGISFHQNLRPRYLLNTTEFHALKCISDPM